MTVKTYRHNKQRLSGFQTILLCVLIMLSFFLAFTVRWYTMSYGFTGFDSILYTLTAGLSGTSTELIASYLRYGLLRGLLFGSITCFILFAKPKHPLLIKKLQIYPFSTRLTAIFALGCSAILLIYSVLASGLDVYTMNMLFPNSLYEKEYADPEEVEITFPEEKRNLVYIMLESMETTYLSQELGGASDVNLIPELTKLAGEGINFSHNDGIGGFHAANGTTWTIGSIVAQTAGIPLKTPLGIDDWQNGYGKEGVFLPGAASITNILEEAGYHTSFLCGSDANFGGRKTYYMTHGMDKVYDIYTARKDGIVPRDYFVWWGMEDLYLFEYAKQELTQLSQQEEPFAFTMLTVDTHHIGGYQCFYCTDPYEESYEQSIACSSRQVLEFVRWLQEQPFYENTTVIITGDHLTMDNGYIQRNVDPGYQRMVFNCILNSPVTTDHTKNREYCAVDLFPTTLAAMGCTIEGDRLGLGVNLFSDIPTLSEQWGYERFNQELSKASEYYIENFHNDPDA